jgi:hypothetical protein
MNVGHICSRRRPCCITSPQRGAEGEQQQKSPFGARACGETARVDQAKISAGHRPISPDISPTPGRDTIASRKFFPEHVVITIELRELGFPICGHHLRRILSPRRTAIRIRFTRARSCATVRLRLGNRDTELAGKPIGERVDDPVSRWPPRPSFALPNLGPLFIELLQTRPHRHVGMPAPILLQQPVEICAHRFVRPSISALRLAHRLLAGPSVRQHDRLHAGVSRLIVVAAIVGLAKPSRPWFSTPSIVSRVK